ncbi:hypothetical protein ACTS9E_04220 [Empedobacter brevis]
MKKYTVKYDFDMLNTLFLKDDEVYIGESEYVMNGIIDYGRKVYNSDRKYLGMIRNEYFYSKIKNKLNN